MKASPTVTLILIGLCFAVPGGAFAWWIARTGPNLWWAIVPVASGVAAALTAMLVWWTVVRHVESTLLSTVAGGMIGVVSHPIAAVLTVLIALPVFSLVVVPDQPPQRPMQFDTLAEFGELLGFIVVWWCLLAICGVGWITLLIGALTGLVVGVSHLYFACREVQHAISHVATTSPPDEPISEERRVERRSPAAWSSLPANLTALGIVNVLSGVALWLTADTVPNLAIMPIIEKAAEV